MFDLNSLLSTVGYLGIFAIIFAESGLLIGMFLPGDSLLFTAGFLASQGVFNIVILCFITFVAAVTGDSVGYYFGRKAGPKIFKKEDSLIFDKKNITRSQEFYKKHGGKTIIFARFVPVVRTFAPILAGVGEMKYTSFLIYNVSGALIWAVGISLLGYFLGKSIPDIDHYLIPITALVVLLSITPSLIHALANEERRIETFAKLRRITKRKKK